MKRIFLFFALLISINLFAQKKDIRLNAGFQFGLPERLFNKNLGRFDDQNMGGGFHLMPVWNYDKNLQFALNLELQMVQEKFVTDAITAYEVLSAVPTVNYRFTTWKIRPYIGMGMGLFGVLFTEGNASFGIRPIVGIAFGDYLNLSAEYSKWWGYTGIPEESDFGNYYLAIKASVSIGLKHTKKNY